jgi:hypothetical protein
MLVTLVVLGGGALYERYRVLVKPALFAEAPRIGWTFERKEHLAFGVLVLTWIGTACYAADARAQTAIDGALRRAAWLSFVLAALLACVVAWMGTVVAATRTF